MTLQQLEKQRQKLHQDIKFLIIVNASLIFVAFLFNPPKAKPVKYIPNPEILYRINAVTPTPSPTVSPTPTIVPLQSFIRGKASYYSIAGCLGCNEARIMANGEKLDDAKLTVAYNHAPLNSYLAIRNVDNGKTVSAKVTDRGGFERHGKIMDLSVATKETLGCKSTCNVEIDGR